MKIEVEITNEMIENIIITALEGGSNYWYFFQNDAYSLVIENEEYKRLPFASALSKLILLEGLKIDIHDLENKNEVLGTLSLESIKKGLEKAFEKDPICVLQMMDESYDADTADVLFQYFVMGEVIFG